MCVRECGNETEDLFSVDGDEWCGDEWSTTMKKKVTVLCCSG